MANKFEQDISIAWITNKDNTYKKENEYQFQILTVSVIKIFLAFKMNEKLKACRILSYL